MVLACENPEREARSKQPVPAPAAAQTSCRFAALSGGRSIADVAEQVTSSVVSVVSETHGGLALRPPGHGEYRLGSGVIVSSDGLIITSNHIVADANATLVALKDGRILEARVVGTDPKSDVAIIRISAKNLRAIRIADSSRLRIGDVVLAIGNPFGIGQTVTMGIVSAVSRANLGITDYDDFIQTDAAINPGNSGGALVNMDGELVGINTAIVSQTGGYEGIGFAIPSRTAIHVKDSLLEHGKVIRGWLGVGIEDLTDERALSLELEPRSGVLISDVTPDSPAAKAGLSSGDVVTAIDGVRTTDSTHLRNRVAMSATGTQLRLTVRRGGMDRAVDVKLEAQPEDEDARTSTESDRDGKLRG